MERLCKTSARPPGALSSTIPRSASATSSSVSSHLQRGDAENAELSFQRAARLDPIDTRARAAHEELRAQRKGRN